MANELDHIYIFEDSKDYTHKIIFMQERIDPSPEQVNHSFNIIRELAAGDEFFLLIDLSNPKPPNIKVRKALKQNFGTLEGTVKKIFIFTGKNKFMNVAAKFVMSSVGLSDFLIFTLKEEAIKAIPKKR